MFFIPVDFKSEKEQVCEPKRRWNYYYDWS